MRLAVFLARCEDEDLAIRKFAGICCDGGDLGFFLKNAYPLLFFIFRGPNF